MRFGLASRRDQGILGKAIAINGGSSVADATMVWGGEWRLAGVWAAFSTSYGEATAVRLFLCHTYAPTPMAADMAISNRIQLSNAANQNISGKSWIRVSERGNNHVSPTKKR